MLLTEMTGYAQQERRPNGGGNISPANVECVTQAQRDAIQRQIDSNIKVLEQRKVREKRSRKKARRKAMKPTSTFLSWPLQQFGTTYFNFCAISNYVDHDTASGHLQDWNCGARTYDLTSGYDHSGTDIFLWPFIWNQMEDQNVSVIAAAPGTIIGKDEGNFDHSCVMSGGTWNAVYVQHADGSIAWYGHLKKNSVTTKAIGATVFEGEYLGFVGSSGNSTGPHLHFELHDAAGNVLDPYTGSCSPGTTWWSPTHTYYESQLNALLTHSAPVVFSPCPLRDEVNACDTFHYGDPLYYYLYFRDELIGQTSAIEIYRPDGSLSDSWTYTSATDYVASYRYWEATVPTGVPYGQWKIVVSYQSHIYTHKFYILPVTEVGMVQNEKTVAYPNPVKDVLYLQGQKNISQVQLTDALGRTVLSAEGDVKELRVDALPAGAYYLRVKGSETTTVERVVKL